MRSSVLWSGGLDSTYLIYSNLRNGNMVDAFYVEVKNNSTKTKKELKAIETISEYFKTKFPGCFTHSIVSSIEVFLFDKNVVLSQVPMWIFSSLWATKDYTNTDQVEIAYVMNDDAISFLEDIKNAYSSFFPFMEKNIPIAFPLSKVKKEEILKFIPEELLKSISVCEGEDENRFCGKCHSCARLKYSLKQIKSDRDFSSHFVGLLNGNKKTKKK
jgi:7-cyano-7-deazaguanine synthase in queuosine biosynthesis